MLLKRSMRGRIDLMGPALAVQKELMSIPTFGDEPEGFLGKERKAIEQAKKAVLMVAGAAAQKFMEKLAEDYENLIQENDMAIQIFTAESAILRTIKIAQQKGEEATKYFEKMTRVYVNDALEKVNWFGKNAVAAFAEGDELKVMLLGLKRFTKFDPVDTIHLRREIADKMIEEEKFCF